MTIYDAGFRSWSPERANVINDRDTACGKVGQKALLADAASSFGMARAATHAQKKRCK